MPWSHVMTNLHWAVCIGEKDKMKQTLEQTFTDSVQLLIQPLN